MWLWLMIAFAGDAAQDAEAVRLSIELARQVEKGTWRPANRTYKRLVLLGVEVNRDVHRLGADASRADGDILTTLWRLNRFSTEAAGFETPDDEVVRRELDRFGSRYAMVRLIVDGYRIPVLTREGQIFDPTEQAAVAFARKVLSETRTYTGMLPLGKYTLDGEEFEVKDPGTVFAFSVK